MTDDRGVGRSGRSGSAAAAPGPVAAVDCGTNSTRLLVLGADRRRLARRMQITRLGAGVDRTGHLDEAAIERTLAVLEEFRAVLDEHGVETAPGTTSVRAAATSATRDADNAGEFLDRAETILGTRPQVIEGTEEGRLSYFGATAELDEDDGPYLVVDIGGGSTELIVGRAAAPASDRTPAAVVSLDVGCVRITERYLRSDPPTNEELGAAHRAARELIDEVRDREPAYGRAKTMIGLAGTVSALTVMALGLERFDEELVHHARVSRERVGELARRLASLPLRERRQLRGMEVERADVIVGGAVVLEEVMDSFGFGELTASEADILDGIAFRLIAARQG
jgi:exopolyphosphatase/guanosine-5'-triphosphate,3'-diphosphate pyrophosphatase